MSTFENHRMGERAGTVENSGQCGGPRSLSDPHAVTVRLTRGDREKDRDDTAETVWSTGGHGQCDQLSGIISG